MFSGELAVKRLKGDRAHFMYPAVPVFPLPMVPGHLLPKWLQRFADYPAVSWLAWLYLPASAYERACYDEVRQLIRHMRRIQWDASRSVLERALLLEAIMAYGLASRPSSFYAPQEGKFPILLPIPIYRDGQLFIEECMLVQEVQIEGVPLRIFASSNGKGSPVCLLPGTGAWRRAPGMTAQILDDLNPIAPGHWLLGKLKEQLSPLLTTWNALYEEKTLLIGHSLGGILATKMAVNEPDLIQRVSAFCPARPFPETVKRWHALKLELPVKKLPVIDTYIPKWKNGSDPLTKVGSHWIGNVYRISYAASCDAIGRHAVFLIPKSGQPLECSLCPEEPRSTIKNALWIGLHRIIAALLFVPAIFCVALKRLLVGWKGGGVLRGGLFAMPYFALLWVKDFVVKRS